VKHSPGTFSPQPIARLSNAIRREMKKNDEDNKPECARFFHRMFYCGVESKGNEADAIFTFS